MHPSAKVGRSPSFMTDQLRLDSFLDLPCPRKSANSKQCYVIPGSLSARAKGVTPFGRTRRSKSRSRFPETTATTPSPIKNVTSANSSKKSRTNHDLQIQHDD